MHIANYILHKLCPTVRCLARGCLFKPQYYVCVRVCVCLNIKMGNTHKQHKTRLESGGRGDCDESLEASIEQ